MKIKIDITYEHPENKEIYFKGKTYIVDKPDNSDFYHRWIGHHLDVIPHNIATEVKK